MKEQWHPRLEPPSPPTEGKGGKCPCTRLLRGQCVCFCGGIPRGGIHGSKIYTNRCRQTTFVRLCDTSPFCPPVRPFRQQPMLQCAGKAATLLGMKAYVLVILLCISLPTGELEEFNIYVCKDTPSALVP